MIAFLHPLGIVHVFNDDGDIVGSIKTFGGVNKVPTTAEALAELKARRWEPQGEFVGDGLTVTVKVVPKR